MFKGLFIDDNESDKGYAERMSESGKLQVEFRKPDKSIIDLADEIIEYKPDLLALDYRLDEVELPSHVNRQNRFKAGPLAQQLRDHAMDNPSNDFPIILVSHEDNIQRFYGPDLTTHDLFDSVYTKKRLVENEKDCKKEFISLTEGYRQLILSTSKPDKLSFLLNIKKDEKGILNKQYLNDINVQNVPHQLARSIFKNITLRYGLLLDRNDVIAASGVNPESKDIDKLIEELRKNDINYTGVFSEGWPRWWSHRLSDFGEKICGDRLGNLNAEDRIKRLNAALGTELAPAKSRWTGKTDALFAVACASCGNPTEMEFSVSAYDPVPVEMMQKKRICFKCIQTGEYDEHKLRIDEGDSFVAQRIESGKIIPSESKE